MTFLNSLPLWGSLAAAGVAVPIIIHLLHQRHRRRTDWAAMELLRRALVIRSGQVRLEDILILLLRCLVLALVAFAMLRPSCRNENAQFLGGEQRVGMVVAIDASYSMAHGEHAKRFDRALEKAEEILKNARVGDPVTVVLLGDKPKILLRGSSYEEQRFQEVLDDAKTLSEGLNLERCLVEIAGLVSELKASIRECYLVTDAQAVDWENLSADAKSGMENIVADAGTKLFITPIAVDDAENLSVMSFEYASGSLVPKGTVRFAAEVRNHGRELQDGGTAILQIDGQDVDRKSIGPIKAGETRIISLYASFDKGGDSKVRVTLDPDFLNEDNQRRTVVHIRDQIRVLCAHDQPASGARPSEIFYLVRALELKKTGESAAMDVVRSDWQNLEAEDFEDYDVILLANGPTISLDVAKRLDSFVRRGGGLGIYAGDKLDLVSYNAHLHGKAVNLLPGELTEVVSFRGDDVVDEDEEETSWTLGPIQSDHVLASLAGLIPEEGRSAAKINKVIQVKPDADAAIILSLSRTDLPLLLEKQVGEGTVLLVTTTADRDWGNLSVHPFFPMMVQQSVTHFTSRPGERTVSVGAPGQVSFPGLQANAQVTLREPEPFPSQDLSEPRAVNLSRKDSGTAFCAIDSNLPGFYEVEPEGLPASSLAVNINPGEADVKVISSDSIGTALGKPEWVISPQDNLKNRIKESREGLDMTRTLLILALSVFLLQGLLAKVFTSRMTTAETGDVTASLRKQTVAAARRT